MTRYSAKKLGICARVAPRIYLTKKCHKRCRVQCASDAPISNLLRANSRIRSNIPVCKGLISEITSSSRVSTVFVQPDSEFWFVLNMFVESGGWITTNRNRKICQSKRLFISLFESALLWWFCNVRRAPIINNRSTSFRAGLCVDHGRMWEIFIQIVLGHHSREMRRTWIICD